MPKLDGAARLDALMNHPARRHITFDKVSKCFRYRGRVVPGLLNPLRRALWPLYKFDTANTARSRRFTKKDPELRRSGDGIKRGSLVHNQVETLTNYGTAPLQKRAEATGAPLLHGYSRNFLLWLRKSKLSPVVSELSLYDAELDIATKADLFCLDRYGRIVLIETKSGYYGSWNRACAPLTIPTAANLSDAPCNQALMQLLFTRRMAQRTYGVRIDRAYVVRADADGVWPEKIPEAVLRSEDVLAAHVAESTRRRRTRRVQRGAM